MSGISQAAKNASIAFDLHDVVNTRLLLERAASLLQHGETWTSILKRLNPPAIPDDRRHPWA